ncbi:transcription factor SPT20 homolog [Pomacea canaliculata]|uniref:transcription factor SPT20 homolog n=1 Tax=Pomacea canaliculata TaxID=400727 RepID=UPI000D725E44|nr:transcription factor SPT20 homolog [Pomacea canaliculata]
MDTSKSRLSLVSQRSKQETPQNMQFVQVLESSGLDTATSLLASNCGDDSMRSDSGIIYVEKDGGVDSESQQINCQVFVENVVLSENQQLLNPTSQVQKIVSHILPSSSHLLYSSSSTSTSSSPSTLVTYVSSPPLNTSPGSQVTYLTSSPLQSLPIQQQAPAVSGPVVTYVIPVATDKSSQHAQHPAVPGASFVSYIASPSEMPRSQQLQIQQQQQQFQIPTSFSGQDIALVQPQNSSKNDTKFTTPVTFALTSLSLSQRTQVPGCIVSVAGNSTANVTSSSSMLQPASSLSSSAPSRQHSGVRTRQKYVKPASELPSSVSLPVIISQGTASNMMAVPSSAQSSSSQLPIGGLTAFHLTSPATSSQSVQYQLQSSQPSSHLQPQQLQQQQQQMVLHPQPQLLLQDQQQQLQMQRTDIPVNVQVIQHGVVQQHQQHLPQHTIPINIITPVNIQQPQPPPPPSPQQQPQPTQIQIILPASAFPPPVAVNPGIGTSSQPQIILQVQEQATSHQQPSAPPPPPPPQQAPATMQEANLAVMSNGRVLSLPPSIMQSILAQLQNGAGVSLSAKGDGETQGLGSVPVHIQEVVIQVDPQQLSSGLMPKHEPNGSFMEYSPLIRPIESEPGSRARK